jgi:hypothetical protein
MSDSVCIH